MHKDDKDDLRKALLLVGVVAAVCLAIGLWLMQPQGIETDGIECIRVGAALDCDWDNRNK